MINLSEMPWSGDTKNALDRRKVRCYTYYLSLRYTPDFAVFSDGKFFGNALVREKKFP
jgi:hypothetical protein